jgi:hypothetical protein
MAVVYNARLARMTNKPDKREICFRNTPHVKHINEAYMG